MENEFSIVDGSLSGQKKGLDDEVYDSRAKEKAEFGSRGSKDFDGADFLEEAVEVKPPIVDSVDVDIDESGDAKENGNSSDDVKFDDKLNAGKEADEFYEAAGVKSPQVESTDVAIDESGDAKKYWNSSDAAEFEDKLNAGKEVDEFYEAAGVKLAQVDSMDVAIDESGDVKENGNSSDAAEFEDKLSAGQEANDFYEAAGVKSPKVDSGDAAIDESSVVKEIGISSAATKFEEILNTGQEADEFCKAARVLSDIHKPKEQSPVLTGSNEEVFGEGEPFALDKISKDESNASENVELREASDTGFVHDAFPDDMNPISEKSVVVCEKCENGVTEDENEDKLSVGDLGTDEQVILVPKETYARDANGVKGVDADSELEVVLKGDDLKRNENGVELGQSIYVVDMDDQEESTRELGLVSANYVCEHQTEKVEELKDIMVSFVTKVKDDESKELNGDALGGLPQEKKDGNCEEQKKASYNFDAIDQGDRIQELEHTSAVVELVHHEQGMEVENEECYSIDERKMTPEIGSTPSLDDSTVVNDDIIRAGGSALGAENCKVSQSGDADANTKVFEILSEPEKVQVKEEVKGENGSATGNGEQKIRPAGDSSLRTEISAVPTRIPALPAGLGKAAPLLEPASRVTQQPRIASTLQNQLVEDPTNGEAEENDETREKLQMIRVKFLRLAYRLGQTPHNVVVAQVLYRLGLAEQLRGRNGGRVAAFSFDRASAMAEQLEAAGQEPLDFSCTIMVLGKTGVGKSATINSIFDEVKFDTDAFQVGTKKVQDVVGTVQGIKVRIIDTPGLLPSWSDQPYNEKILHSIKRFMKKTPPDIVLYLDRLDMQSRDFGDMPLLHKITEVFGPSIWFNAIVVLTHAASAPPEGPNGSVTSYDMFVSQGSHVVQQAIRQAAGDMRLMNPVSFVENHSACRTNTAGQRVLPNDQVWKPHLLLLSFASKILAEANMLLKLQDSPPGKPFITRVRTPPLHFFLSSLLQSRPQVQLPAEQYGDDGDSLDDDLEESSDSDDESEYDELPPFKQLTQAKLAKLTKAQKKAYYDELEYREKLFMKKQLKEEKKRRKMMKKMADSVKEFPSDHTENAEEESSGAASVPVPMPDLPLPASFDSHNPSHRYRCLDSLNQWLVRPVLESHGWDHDVGYEGINAERLFVFKDKVPISFSGQLMKDKKDLNVQMDVASTLKHGEGKATSLGFDMQTMGKEIAYTVRSETKFCNLKRNKATAGLSLTILGDLVTGGVKVEDKLIVNRRGQLVMSGGAVVGRGAVAWGGNLEATLKDKDHPLGRFLSTFGLSAVELNGDLALSWNVQSQIPIGRFTNLIGRVNLNNRGSGQVSVRLNSSEHLQIVLFGLISILRKLPGYSQPS